MAKVTTDRFIPTTMARPIGGGVLFRPIRSWHSATYAGEKLTVMPGGTDRSGCMSEKRADGIQVCHIPYSVTHRVYWHERNSTRTVSAFLSYPDAMGYSDGKYFWETYGISDDVERYFGDNAEVEMEDAIRTHFAKEPAK